MPTFFNPTPEQRRELETIADGIPEVQHKLVSNHQKLTMPDRGAHQQQLAASKVLFTVADSLPPALEGLGIFQRGQAAPRIGIGRMSTGLGCPHAETDADFLGLMVAFRAPSGRRIDFITINDPTSPTDTPEEFLALLQATADAAAASGMFASQARLLLSLARHAGLRAPAIATHVTTQTLRTTRSTTAFQQYWTGIVRARDTLGKFTFVPKGATASIATPHGPTQFTDDWRARQSAGPLTFDLRWIPFIDERATPLDDLTHPWANDREVSVGTVTFPQTSFETRDAQLTTLLASELGANPGNWEEAPHDPGTAPPATRFTAARHLAYAASQRTRDALEESAYATFFDRGEISPALEQELLRRLQQKRAAGHWVPDVGEIRSA